MDIRGARASSYRETLKYRQVYQEAIVELKQILDPKEKLKKVGV